MYAVFEAKQTIWRYYVVKDKYTLNNPEIPPVTIPTDAGPTVTFALKDDNHPIPGDQTALWFQSETAIPLQEEPQWNIRLTSDDNTSGWRLPYASDDYIHGEHGQSTAYSDIYYYF